MKDTGFRRFICMALVTALVAVGIVRTAHAGKVDETPVTVTGVLSVMYADDFENKRSELSYVVKDAATKEHFTLRFKNKEPKNLKTGMTVTAKGKARGKELFLDSDANGGESIAVAPVENALVEGTSEVGTLTGSSLVGGDAVAGEQKTLVMVANFQDVGVTCSNPAVTDLMFSDPLGNSVDALYRQNSQGSVWLSGQVVGPYLINYTSTGTCDYNAWGDAIDAAAVAAGIDLSPYSRKIYVMPENSCPAAGIGNVGGSSTRAWIFYCDVPDVFAHELGHNLGMLHASTPTSDYGDTSDIMGLSVNKLRQINAPHKEQVGWLPDNRTQTVSQTGLYNVAPLEINPATAPAPLAIKLTKTDTGELYYLSYRQSIGFDANLSPTTQLDRLSVHLWNGTGKTYLLATLADGESFVDAVNGITVTQVGHTPDYSTVQVDLAAAPCSRNTPLISASPTSQNGLPGASLNYTVSVTNTDSQSCAPSVFSLASSVPVGWNNTLSGSSLTLSPGQSAPFSVSITSPTGAVEGTYGANVSISDTASANHSASAAVNYVVLPQCTPAAPLVSISPANQSGLAGTTLSYLVTVTNNSSASCGSSPFSLSQSVPAGWSGILSQLSLALSPGQSGTTTLFVSSSPDAAPGVYGVSTTVSSTYTSSVNATYTVQAPADTQPPTTPTGLAATLRRTQVQLAWSASSDNVGVVNYSVWRNDVRIGTISSTSFNDTPPSGVTTVTYVVRAHDAAGNTSASSNSVTLTLGSTKVKK